MKVSELQGVPLDWAVAKCEKLVNEDGLDVGFIRDGVFTPSTDWAQGGPIIERCGMDVVYRAGWVAYRPEARGVRSSATSKGPTPLIAAMRCYCCSKLGETVEVPEELT